MRHDTLTGTDFIVCKGQRPFALENLDFGKRNYNAWSKRKKIINQRKKFIQLSLGLQSMYIYPGEKNMFAVDFKQNYLSDNYKGVSDKTIYWKKSAEGQWKIIYEGDRA